MDLGRFRILTIIGTTSINFVAVIGDVCVFAFRSLFSILLCWRYLRLLPRQLFDIGFGSLSIISVSALFMGGALILQGDIVGSSIVAFNLMPRIVTLSVVRELGPVVICLLLAGRNSTAMAVELGVMKITEQIDELYVLNVDFYRYLVAPRILATIIASPILILCSDVIGIFGGYLVGTRMLNYDSYEYVNFALSEFVWHDVLVGLVKGVTFGCVLAISGCYFGYKCYGGSRGVGVAASSAAVVASLLVIIINCFITYVVG